MRTMRRWKGDVIELRRFQGGMRRRKCRESNWAWISKLPLLKQTAEYVPLILSKFSFHAVELHPFNQEVNHFFHNQSVIFHIGNSNIIMSRSSNFHMDQKNSIIRCLRLNLSQEFRKETLVL